MDSRKFLSTINNSSQSKVSLFESLVKKLGEKAGAQWQLAALFADTLFIEDINGGYFAASHKRLKGGKIQITNIKPVKIVEEQKQTLFGQNCTALVEAIEKNDQRAMRTSYNNLAAQRFSPRTIPESGLVKTRDGIVRRLQVDTGEQITAEDRDKIVGALVESINDTIVLESGRVISATFGEDANKRIPISEWACRRVVGRHMRETAVNAYQSPGFQSRIYKVAKLINADQVKEAVESLKNFLTEQQEFCLLTRQETQSLVENTLAAKAVMNQQLCIDTATLFYRSNLRINRDSIIKEWRATAQKAQHPTLLENVIVLEQSKNFEGAYTTFLEMAFNEALSPRDEEVAAYRLALDMLRTSPKIQEDQQLQTKVNELITKLSDPDVDDATVHLVRETLAAAKQEADSLSKLSDFDEMPGDEPGAGEPEDLGDELGDELGGAAEVGAGNGGTVINVNAPLISIGGEAADLGAGEDLGDLAGEEGGEEDLGELAGDEDLADMGGLGDEDEEEEPRRDDEINLQFDSKQKRGSSTVAEAVNKALGRTRSEAKWAPGEEPWSKGGKKDDDAGNDDNDDEVATEKDETMEDECVGEGCDPYAFGEDINFESSMGHDYGRPTITTEMDDVIASMVGIAEEKNLIGEGLFDKIGDIATRAIAANGIKIPGHRLGSAVEQVSAEFKRRLDEDQFKWGTLLRRRGMNKARINKKEREGSKGGKGGKGGGGGGDGAAPTASKGISGPPPQNESKTEDSIQWLEHDESNSGVLGSLGGIKFILDYADPPILFSEDGKSVQVPIPEELVESALASTGLKEGAPEPFARWLAGGIEQFRPISEADEKALAEAVATITAAPDGSISVAVDGDVGVEEMGPEGPEGPEIGPEGPEMGPEGPEMGPEGPEMGPEGPEGGMQPVADMGDEIEAAEVTDELPGDEMPDFEGGAQGVPEGPEPEEEEEEGEGEEEEFENEGIVKPSVAEDRDSTSPESKGKYDTTKEDHRSRPKEAGKAQKPKDGGNLDGFDKKPEKVKTDSPDTELKAVKPGKNRPS
jgi:hypothetical protein